MRDPGAQPERTWLAWRRTTLSCAVSVALAARVALAEPSGLAVVAAGLGALAWVGLLVTAHRRIGALAQARPGTMGAAQTAGTLLCVLVLIGVGGMMLV
ncbi:DUF202 domain-containing protein [Streptomyces oryzae]|uniref:DUF202 domain-containing protein n=1 Tax=Streptomyces oryzae TaxID=1434886 RepID=A0ABS3XCL5_9ACTN|nr:DUF202 domain-containing protein [Streptomyces oryzae]